MIENNHPKTIAQITDLKVTYPVNHGMFDFRPRKTLKAVDGVSFSLGKGEILGLVGESGCGKSSLGKALLRLVKASSGKIEIDGEDFLALRGRRLRQFRPNIQMIFQDPYASLDPRMTVFDILHEPLATHLSLTRSERDRKILAALDLVGLPAKAAKKYSHEFSGGQRQRVAIARALILDPKIIIADEPVSSLDVSVQAQILNLLKDIQCRLGLSLVFISHNLAVVKYISDRIAVMYLGKIVEVADKEAIYRNPLHPYTKALVSAVPVPDPRLERTRLKLPLHGEIPSPIDPPQGCTFHTRCPIAADRCRTEVPTLKPKLDTLAKSPRTASCFLVE